MDLDGAVIVVTGGGRGIGRALCERFAHERAAAIVVADADGTAAEEVAASLGGIAVAMDAASEADVIHVLDVTEKRFGVPDLFCANAGIGADGDLDAPDELWERSWQVNVMSQVYAARHSVPRMLARGHGYLLFTASAAGLLSMPGAAPYAVSKHAAVAIAEYVSITYGGRGIGVSCLCPQAVDTRLLREQTDEAVALMMLSISDVLEPAQVAATVVEGLANERFLILPHADVADHVLRRASDPDRWLSGMRRIARSLSDDDDVATADHQNGGE